MAAFREWLRAGLAARRHDLEVFMAAEDLTADEVWRVWTRPESFRLLIPAHAAEDERAAFRSGLLLVVQTTGGSAAAKADARVVTRREWEIVELLAAGKQDKEISQILKIQFRTVRFHVTNLLRKYKASNRTELVSRVLSQVR